MPALCGGRVRPGPRGVSKTEIVLGTAQDLSGPVVRSPSRGQRHAHEAREINDSGGLHGRKLRLVVEEHGYDPKKAVLAGQKRSRRTASSRWSGDRHADAMAGMPIYLEKNVAAPVPAVGRGARCRAAAPAEILRLRDLFERDARRASSA